MLIFFFNSLHLFFQSFYTNPYYFHIDSSMSQFSFIWFSFILYIFSLHRSIYYFFSSSSPACFLSMSHKLAFLSGALPVYQIIFAVISPEGTAAAPQGVLCHLFVFLQTFVQIFCFPELLFFPQLSQKKNRVSLQDSSSL